MKIMESIKAKQLRKHIDECEEVLAENNPRKAAEQIEMICQAYYCGGEEFSIKPAFDKMGNIIYESDENLENLKCLIKQMEVRLGQWADEYNTQQNELQLKLIEKQNNATNSININHQNNNTANAIINQNINLETTLKSINKISNEILDEKDKKYLENILREIDKLKEQNKEKTKNKIFGALKYIIDKGIEVGIAILPYLGEVAKILR